MNTEINRYNANIDYLLEFGTAEARFLMPKRLLSDSPQTIASDFFEAEISRSKLLPTSYRKTLVQILNHSLEHHGHQTVAPKLICGEGSKNRDQQKNRYAVLLELNAVKIVALVAATYVWPSQFNERDILKAWFHVTANPHGFLEAHGP